MGRGRSSDGWGMGDDFVRVFNDGTIGWENGKRR